MSVETSSSLPHIAIIGAGISGLSIALFLHRAQAELNVANFTYCCYEAYSNEAGIVGGLQIAPNGMKVLNELGVAEELIQSGSVCDYYVFKNHSGAEIARIKLGGKEKFGQPSVSMSRYALHHALQTKAEAFNLPVQFGKKLVSFQKQGDATELEFADGSKVAAAVVIAADGIHSRIRQTLYPKIQPAPVGILGIGGFINESKFKELNSAQSSADGKEPPQLPANEMWFTFGPVGFFGMGYGDQQYINPQGNSEAKSTTDPKESEKKERSIMWWSNIPYNQALSNEEIRALSLEDMKKMLNGYQSDWHAPIPLVLNQWFDDTAFRAAIYDVQHVDYWFDKQQKYGNIVLIGDSAHAVSPNSGQGASQALEDSMLLGKLIKQQLNNNNKEFPSSAQWQQVFQAFQVKRQGRVEAIIQRGRQSGEAKQKKLGKFACWLRDKMMGWIFYFIGEKMFDDYFGYTIHWNSEEQLEGLVVKPPSSGKWLPF
jgi:2-polyprenyl-6-methoxyphenol hydroxylase-like FAD-dependent oxidoreductase